MRYYAGIGSRRTPRHVLEVMEAIAENLACEGYTLRSGGADGADAAFEKGCDKAGGDKHIYLPWKNFNGNPSAFYEVGFHALQMAARFHPAWNRLSDGAAKLQGRNCYQVLGLGLADPVDFIVCWTPGANMVGGTAQALRIAHAYDIPVRNLADPEILKKAMKWLGMKPPF